MILLDLGGTVASLRGLAGGMEEGLRSEWGPFVLREGEPEIVVDVRVAPPREDCRPFSAKRMAATFEGGIARYVMEEGEARVPPSGPVEIGIGPCGANKQLYALLTLLGAAFAWRAPSHGTLVLHAAGVVLDGRSFVLAGAEGAGKTTFARLAAEAGVAVLGDDLVVVRAAERGVEAVGSPLRSRPWNTTGRGAWPLAALLLPEHGTPASLRPAAPMSARARLVASLPFVAEALDRCPGLDAALEAIVRTPARVLRFAPDPGWLPLLRGFAP